MASAVDKIREMGAYALEKGVEYGKMGAKFVIKMDASEEKYGENGVEQLKGRAKQFFMALLVSAVMAGGATLLIHMGVALHGPGTVIMATTGAGLGVATLFAVKETALQGVSLLRELREDSPETE